MTPEERKQVRNETIDEMTDWLDSCIQQVDQSSEVFKACTAMVNAMRGKKTDGGTRPAVPPPNEHSRK